MLHHAEDPYFGIGCLKGVDHGPLLRRLQHLRDNAGFREELHWASFDKGLFRGREEIVSLGKEAIDLVFDDPATRFYCAISDRRNGDLTRAFRGHPHAAYKAYEELAGRVIDRAIDDPEVVTVLADQMSVPAGVHFELDVRSLVNGKRDRLAVATVSRVDSRCSVGLQLVDLLLGAAAYDLRRGAGDPTTQKARLAAHLLDRCDVPSFRPRGRTCGGGRFQVDVLGGPKRTRRGPRRA